MDTLKELIEKRNMLLDELDKIKVDAETRAITEDEDKKVDEMLEEIRSLDSRIKVLSVDAEKTTVEKMVDELPVSEELRSILLNPTFEVRAYGQGAGNNFKLSDSGQGGVIMPKTLSNKIIEKAVAISDLLPKVTRYSLTGELIIPKFDRSTISVAFYDEFAETVESNAGFTSIKLNTHRISGLVVLSRVLINNVDMDIEGFIVSKLAETFKEFLEKCLCQGVTGKFDSLFTATDDRVITLPKKDAWDIDTLIDIRIKLHNDYQKRAVYVMNPKLLTTLRKLKDAQGHYYVLPDVTKDFGFTILGTNILVSDFAPEDKILYGDLSCYTVSSSQEMEMTVLREKYATQYAVGTVVHGEFGGKIVDEQGFAIIKNKA